jgi:anti-sigma factor RsiW
MGEVHCEEAAERSTDYLEGALTPHERRRYERHLAACVPCSADLRRLQALIALAGQLPAPAPSPAPRERLLAAFRARHRAP